MEAEQRVIVYGYVRSNYNGSIIKDIINIIYNYYLIRIASKLLHTEEQMALMDLLFTRIKRHNKNIQSIDTKLLFRASDNNGRLDDYDKKCFDKGSTVSIIHNNNNHIYGGYTSKSFSSEHYKYVDDPNAFLFVIRPKLKCFELKKENKNGKNAICSYFRGSLKFGPIYGEGWDIYVEENMLGFIDEGRSHTFDFDPKELRGAKGSEIVDFELFAI